MIDHADKSSILRPTWRNRLANAISSLRTLSVAMRTGEVPDHCSDPMYEVKRLRALEKLGARWVGDPKSTLEYKRGPRPSQNYAITHFPNR